MRKIFVTMLLLALFANFPLHAANYNWTEGAGESGTYRTWENTYNWSGGTYPGQGDTATIDYSGDYIIALGKDNPLVESRAITVYNGNINLDSGHLLVGSHLTTANTIFFADNVGKTSTITMTGGILEMYPGAPHTYWGGNYVNACDSTTVFTLNQQGGRVIAPATLMMGGGGASGTWTMAPGTSAHICNLYMGTEGGTSTLTMNSAQITSSPGTPTITVGSGGTGTLNATNSLIQVSSLYVGQGGSMSGVGEMTMTGGALNLGVYGMIQVGTSMGDPDVTTARGTVTLNSVAAGGDVHYMYVGEGHNATGEFYINGGSLRLAVDEMTDSAGNMMVGASNGRGTVVQNHAAVAVKGEVIIGSGDGTGEYDINGGNLTILAGLTVGGDYEGTGGTGTFNHNSGNVNVVGSTTGVIIGDNSGSVGEYNMKSGSLRSHSISVGYGGTGTLNQTGGAIILKGKDEFSGSGILVLSYDDEKGRYNIRGGSFKADSFEIDNGEVNIYGGSVQVETMNLRGYADGTCELNLYGGTLDVTAEFAPHGDVEHGDVVDINIFGSKNRFTAEAFNVSREGAHANYRLDKQGTTTLVGTELLDTTSMLMEINMDSGFLSLATDHFDLVSSKKLMADDETVVNTLADLATVNAENNTPYIFTKALGSDNGQKQLRYIVNETGMESWDLLGEFRFSDTQEVGTLKVEGLPSHLQAIFTGLEEDDGMLAGLLVNYLNSGVLDTGAKFSLVGTKDILLTGNYLSGVDNGYAYFGWDLTQFNLDNNSGIGLLGFNEVPEPATWGMLLMGIAAMVYVRKRRREA